MVAPTLTGYGLTRVNSECLEAGAHSALGHVSVNVVPRSLDESTALGGSIKVDSRLGQGARFTVELPISSTVAAAQ